MHFGSGPGLSPRTIGQSLGAEAVTLTVGQGPSHNHDMRVASVAGTQNVPTGGFLASSPNVRLYRPTPPVGINLAGDTIGPSPGGSQSHSNLMPYLCVNFIIALFGIYPSRN